MGDAASEAKIHHLSQSDVLTNKIKQKSVRMKKKTERFGETGTLTLSDDDDTNNSFERMLSDDSSDEYKPENPIKDFHKRIVHSVGHIDPKRRKVHHNDIQSKISFDENFDDEFDEMNSSNNQLTNDSSKTNGQFNISVNLNKNDTDRISDSIIESIPNGETNLRNVGNQKECEMFLTGESKNIDSENVNRKLLVEILARIRNIEDSMMKSGCLLVGNKNNVEKGKSFDDFHTFLKSNRLPLQNIDDMNMFEKNLNDPEFKNVAVRNICKKCTLFEHFQYIPQNIIIYLFHRQKFYQYSLEWQAPKEINQNY